MTGPAVRRLVAAACAIAAPHAAGQHFHYAEPGGAGCSAPPAAAKALPKTVQRGAPVPGSIKVACGLDKGSYTVAMNSTDPGAAIQPRTFLVNFGKVVGNGGFVVRFSTPGEQGLSASITSNMGSPAVQGRFVSAADTFMVAAP